MSSQLFLKLISTLNNFSDFYEPLSLQDSFTNHTSSILYIALDCSLDLGTLNILGWIVLFVWALSCIIGHLAAFVTSTHEMI